MKGMEDNPMAYIVLEKWLSLWAHVTRTPDHSLLFVGSLPLRVSRFRKACIYCPQMFQVVILVVCPPPSRPSVEVEAEHDHRMTWKMHSRTTDYNTRYEIVRTVQIVQTNYE